MEASHALPLAVKLDGVLFINALSSGAWAQSASQCANAVLVAGQLARRCPLRELYVQLLELLSHLFEAKTIDEHSEDDAPADIDTERPHAHCTGAAKVRGRCMKKTSA